MTKRLVPILLALGLALGAGPSGAVAPELLSYQGVLLQSNGVAVANGTYSLRFRLFDHATAGTMVFEQTLSAQVTSGLYNVVLSNNGTYDLSDIVAENTQLFMEVTVLGTPNVTLLPRQQLASVPYALTGIPPPPPTPPTPPGTFLAEMAAFGTEAAVTANAWFNPTGLSGLDVQVPAANCVLEVTAEVSLGSDGGTDYVGVRLEQSYNAGAYTTVRGPSMTEVVQDGATARVTYVASAPSSGTYVYRVGVREENDGDFELNPSVSPTFIGATQSILAYELWCP